MATPRAIVRSSTTRISISPTRLRGDACTTCANARGDDAVHSISPNIRAARRALQKSLFQKRRQDELAGAAVNVPQSPCLRLRQLQPRHLSVLALDSTNEVRHGSRLTGERDAAFAVYGALYSHVSNRGKQRSRSGPGYAVETVARPMARCFILKAARHFESPTAMDSCVTTRHAEPFRRLAVCCRQA